MNLDGMRSLVFSLTATVVSISNRKYGVFNMRRMSGKSRNFNETIEVNQGRFERRLGLKEEAIDWGSLGESRFQIPVQDEHYELREFLKSAIIRRSFIDGISQLKNPDREAVVLVVRDFITSINRIQSEWLGFLKSLVRIDVTRQGYAGNEADENCKKAVGNRIDTIFRLPELVPLFISSPMTAAVVSQEPLLVWEHGLAYAWAKIDELVDRMIQNLDCLVNQFVCGILTRYPNQVCDYFYGYRRVLIDTSDPTPRVRYVRTDDPSSPSREMFITTTTTNSSVQFINCIEQHHLIHVIETDLAYGIIEVPAFQRSVIEAIPEWLRPNVSLIEGTLIGQQLIEADEAVVQVQTEQQLNIRYHYDPAVILGQFVLTAWGPTEIQAEKAERVANDQSSRTGTLSKIATGIRSQIHRMLEPS